MGTYTRTTFLQMWPRSVLEELLLWNPHELESGEDAKDTCPVEMDKDYSWSGKFFERTSCSKQDPLDASASAVVVLDNDECIGSWCR
jgi:hypothetical protein